MLLSTLVFFIYLNFQRQAQQNNQQPAPAEVKPNDNPLLNEQPASDKSAELGAPEASSEKVVTLGSMDSNKKFNLLVTITSRGASVERAELVGQDKPGKFRFISLEHEGGYLGYLGLVEDTGGMRIRAVPDGSPVAAAKSGDLVGLQVGDVIREVAEHPVASLNDLHEALRKTKAGQEVDVKVDRAGQSLTFKVQLSHAPLDLIRSTPVKTEQILGNQELNSLRTTLAAFNSTKIPSGKTALPALASTYDRNWDVRPLEVDGGQGVEFRLPLDSMLDKTDAPKLELVKRYRLYPVSDKQDGYMLDMEVVVVNNNDKPVKVALRQEGPTGMTLEGWWYSVKISQAWFAAAGHRDVAFGDNRGTHFLTTTRDIYANAKKTATQPHTVLFSEGEPLDTRTLKYIGVDSQYFNASMLPHPEDPTGLSNLSNAGARLLADPALLKRDQIQAANVAFWFDTADKELAPGQQSVNRYSIFLGPKESNLLASHGLGLTIEYGWFPWVAKPLGWILHVFYAIVGNYGLAIIMLTVCVRLALFPLGRRAAITGQRMQELQPEIKKINEKYQDMGKRTQAMQELYAKHNFKPLAGCLPMFLQIPIFIGLYRCLSVDVSLRQEPLIPGLTWCSNLAGPDQFYNWSGWMWEYLAGRGTGWLGPYFNILPLVTVTLFLVQQHFMMPKTDDPQQQMTQTMMKWMTVFMGVMFFKVPAGLCVYFITSSIWSLVERRIIKKTIPAAKVNSGGDDESGSTAKPKQNRPSPNDRTKPVEPPQQGMLGKLAEMLEKPNVRNSTQRGSSKKRKK
ncbi:MAG: membrane protein insertase YidC [Pirellulales bacterium]